MTRRVSLVIEAELTSPRLAELGRPAGAYRCARAPLVALASVFEPLYWPGRAIYEGHKLRYRLSLYDLAAGAPAARVAVFDGARYPINDVAFHPGQPLVALATGSYDGGWAFEGELLLWNWQTGERVHVLSERRDVARVRFTDEGRLRVLLRPRDEEEHGAADAFTTFVGGELDDLRPFAQLGLTAGQADPRIAGFPVVEPSALELAPAALSAEQRARRWEELAGAVAGGELEERHRVWDVAWEVPAGGGGPRVLAVHDGCHRSEERRVGKECRRLCRSRWSPYH
jgi:hypothetical protein